MTRRLVSYSLLASLLLVGAVSPAYATLERVGPVNPAPSVGGYPAWYQDTTGLTLEFCDPKSQAEVDGGWCLLLPGDVVVPEVFPTNFFDEHFYFDSVASLSPTGGKALLVLALEGAFAVGPPIPGDQITFARIRVKLTNVPVTGTYRFIHPYGEELIDAEAGAARGIFFTEDIGIGAPGDFTAALLSRMGPFLLPAATPGGLELPATVGPSGLYIADPARLGPVTGSPIPTFVDSTGAVRNHNIFRIEGPAGSALGVDPVSGAPVDWIETTDFSLMGRIMAQTIPGRVAVDRASYTRTATAQKVDVFAAGFETTQGRLPTQTKPVAVLPALSFFDAPCGGTVDPVTGAVSAPFTAPAAGAIETQMLNSGNNFWGQALPALIPSAVCVKDSAARDATGAIVPAFFAKVVTDEVTITEAFFDPSAKTLSVKATSSDATVPPVLTLGAFGDLTAGAILVPLLAPPAKVTVLSSAFGVNNFQVTTGFIGAAPPPTAGPVAVNDAATVLEDSGANIINVLANDTNAVGGTVTIVAAPRLGTATLNADGTVTFTPALNAFGADSFTYTVTVGTTTSNIANVAITVTPVNDPPTAVNDAFTVVVNTPTTLNLLANDTDPDGNATIVSAVVVTQPAAGASVTVTAGVVTFTATAPGAYTFTYQAQDAAGALSNVATVSVTAISSDVVVIASALFRTGQHRWIISGTDSVPNRLITITYANGAEAGATIGTAQADAAGNWLLDLRGVSGVLDPTDAATPTPRPTAVRATSTLGGTAVLAFTVRS